MTRRDQKAGAKFLPTVLCHVCASLRDTHERKLPVSVLDRSFRELGQWHSCLPAPLSRIKKETFNAWVPSIYRGKSRTGDSAVTERESPRHEEDATSPRSSTTKHTKTRIRCLCIWFECMFLHVCRAVRKSIHIRR